MFNIQNFLSQLIYILPAVLISLSVHEFAHAFVSYKLGDISQRSKGRLTLNPLKHLDPVGTICLIFFGFGWAKPVMVDPYYYRNKKEGMMWTALAGPFMNFIVAFLSIVLICVLLKTVQFWFITTRAGTFCYSFLTILTQINIGLGIFNLIPIPPLDGSKILAGILPEDMYFSLMKYENYFMIAIILLLATGALNGPLIHARELVQNAFLHVVMPLFGLG